MFPCAHFVQISFTREAFFILSFFSIRFLLIMQPYIVFRKSDLGNWFGQSAKYRGLKIYMDVTLYDKQDGSSKVVNIGRSFSADTTGSDEFQRNLHGVDLNRARGADYIFIGADKILMDKFLLSYPY